METPNPYIRYIRSTQREITTCLYLELLGSGFVKDSSDFDQTLLTLLTTPTTSIEHEYFFQALYKVTLDRVRRLLADGERLDMPRFQEVFYREYLQGKFHSESFFEKASWVS